METISGFDSMNSVSRLCSEHASADKELHKNSQLPDMETEPAVSRSALLSGRPRPRRLFCPDCVAVAGSLLQALSLDPKIDALNNC